ncbi:hypothetical protein EVG20_g5404 [Dentipellis fragilis]|uniref:Transcription activator of gluconeogenesis ERT1 n=1 Tax=Dentipellis fragilis TaxID=205917 RepID=A0A4Y9YVI8_9AGAM|nr:hypothetical protein EVG20_g5404 [Dentipellis fragilis]
MASVRGQSGEADEEPQHDNSPSADSVQPQMTMHSVSYSSMPMHMYPFAPGMMPNAPQIRSKRRQVKNACTNCQKACKKCDDARPCLRCVKYGIGEECVDSQRKERKKGIKRGPYKKRDGKNNNVEQQLDNAVPHGMGMPPGMPPASVPPTMPYMGQMGYPPPYYGQYPAVPPPKPGEAPAYYPQFYLAPVPHPPPPGQDGDAVGYGQPQPQYYPATFIAPYAQPYPPTYMMPPHHRPDAQMAMHNGPYGYPMYPKPPSAGGSIGRDGAGRVTWATDEMTRRRGRAREF